MLAIFLGPIGGIIGYFVLKDRDRKFAERLLIVGFVMILVGWLLSILLSELAYIYIISDIFTAKTAVILSIDPVATQCSGNTIMVYVRNEGTSRQVLLYMQQLFPVEQPILYVKLKQ